jgi:hypothetical protein
MPDNPGETFRLSLWRFVGLFALQIITTSHWLVLVNDKLFAALNTRLVGENNEYVRFRGRKRQRTSAMWAVHLREIYRTESFAFCAMMRQLPILATNGVARNGHLG